MRVGAEVGDGGGGNTVCLIKDSPIQFDTFFIRLRKHFIGFNILRYDV